MCHKKTFTHCFSDPEPARSTTGRRPGRAAVLSAGLLLVLGGQRCIPSTGDGDTPPPTFDPQTRVRIETTKGVIILELFDYQAPLTVANFLQYVSEGFYDGTLFHEVVERDTIAAGQYTDDLEAKSTRGPVANESNNGLRNLRGRVALVEPGGTGSGTGTSAFLINVADNPDQDFDLESGRRGRTVFGRVVEGMDIVDDIAELDTARQTARDGTTLASLPVERVRIIRAAVGTGTTGENHAPLASAGADQTLEIGDVVVLDGSASSDPDGDVITFLWRQTSGPTVMLSNPAVIRPSFAASAVATMTFELTVTDSGGLSSVDSLTITVNSVENEAPVANAGTDQTVVAGATVTLDGSGSIDPDGGELAFSWVQTGGLSVVLSDATAALPTFTAPSTAGSLTFELLITDELGGLASDTVTIRVNLPPTADAGADRNVAEKVTVALRGVGTDPDPADPLTFLWRQTAGPNVDLSSAIVAQPTLVVPAGSVPLSFELTVTDSGGARATDAVTLTPITAPRVRLATTMGDLVLDLLEDEAPITATNFLQYVEDGFYNGTIFHRVINNPDPFVIQGGGFEPDLTKRTEGLRDPILNEFSADRSNLRGTVAMAKLGGDPNSATSQFFINLGDNSENLDNQNGGFTVFAIVETGMDLVDQIAAVETSTQTGPDGTTFTDVPVTDVIVNTATLE